MTREQLIALLAADAVLGRLVFEAVELAEIEAVVTRLVPPAEAVALWRAARAIGSDDFWPLLTDEGHIHPDIGPVTPRAAMSLELARAARKRFVRESEDASAALKALERASPQVEPYEERDIFFGPFECPHTSLVFVRGTRFDAIRPFSPDGEGACPRMAELLAMLEHWNQRYGVEPFYADGGCLELEVHRPPQDPDELRSLAREFFLTSQGTAEGYGIEDPARLMRRLMSDRWVLWWFGTY